MKPTLQNGSYAPERARLHSVGSQLLTMIGSAELAISSLVEAYKLRNQLVQGGLVPENLSMEASVELIELWHISVAGIIAMARLGLHAGSIHLINREAMYLKTTKTSCYIVILRNVPYKKYIDGTAVT